MTAFRPGMPGIFLSLAADTSVASGAPIPYATVDWQEQWPWASAGVLVVPRTGTYMVSVRWIVQATATATTKTIGLRRAGSEDLGSQRYPATSAEIRGAFTTQQRLVDGDEITVTYVGSTGAAATLTGVRNSLRAVRIGPEKWT